MRNCPNCGHTNLPSATFCGECGRPLPTGRPCPDCGFAGNPSQAAYCIQCGASLRRRSFAPFIWLGGLVLVIVAAVILWQMGLLEEWVADLAAPLIDRSSTPAVTPSATLEPDEVGITLTASHTPTPSPTLTQPPTAAASPTITQPPTATPPPSPTPTVTPQPSLQWTSIGQSVQSRDLSVAVIGYEDGDAIVVVGSIQGDQSNTRDLTNSLVDYFQDLELVPDGVAFYFIPSLNPDGNVSNSRYNANQVDLNRNWETSDWRSKAVVPGYPNGKPGAGGSSSFSEPETRALRDLLLALKSQGRDIRVIVLHSSVRRTQGEVYPGGDDAVDVANQYASAAGYNVERAWADYATSGEVVTWCSEQGIASIDIVLPGSQEPSSIVPGTGDTLQRITARALLAIADFP